MSEYRCPNCSGLFWADAEVFAQVRKLECPHCLQEVFYMAALLMSMANLIEHRLTRPSGPEFVEPM